MEENPLQQVRQRSLYGPSLPDVLIRPDEAGDPLSPLSSIPITWERSPSPLNLKTHLEKPSLKKDSKSIPDRFQDFLVTLKIPFLLDELAEYQNGNPIGFRIWLLAYALTNRLSDSAGWKYLSQIARDSTLYPKQIEEALNEYIQPYRQIRGSAGYPSLTHLRQEKDSINNLDHYPQLIVLAEKLRLYLPKNLSLDDLDWFFLTSLYWLRYFRSERPRIAPQIDSMNLIDLYLVTANPFERYPARKLLSYYDDEQLFIKFGRLGNYYFPKTYPTKLQQLDALVALSRYRFGYFEVTQWESPIQLKFHLFSSPLTQSNSKEISLDELVQRLEIQQSEDSELVFRYPTWTDSHPRMPLLQLAIMIESSLPLLSNSEDWKPFMDKINSVAHSLHREYQILHENPFQLETHRNPKSKVTLELNSIQSVEQEFNTCILCMKVRSPQNFGYCGHGVCSMCQSQLKTVKCPFCSEHFVSGDLSDEFVRQMMDSPYTVPSHLIRRIDQIIQLRVNREFKFDWGNSNVRRFN